MTIERDALAASAGADFSGAADLTERLVLDHGLDYRTAYRIVGRAVVRALADDRARLRAADLTLAAGDLGLALGGDVAATVATLSDVGALVAGRVAVGGSAPDRIAEHGAGVRAVIADARVWADATRATARRTEAEVVTAARDRVQGGNGDHGAQEPGPR
jgi:argininosuccinate lyase